MMLSAGFGGVRGSPLRNQWFLFCVAICVFLVIVTGIARLYLFDGLALKVLFKLSLAVENNVGAWTSGMLLLLLALHAFDGYAFQRAAGSARLAQAWGILSGLLAFLSLDEIASLHERIRSLGTSLGIGDWTLIVPLGLLLGILSLRALWILWMSGGAHRRVAVLVFLGFALLGSVVLQEVLEYRFLWENPALDAVRVSVEEGTELAGMLLLLWVMMDNTAPFARSGSEEARPTFALVSDHWRKVLATGLVIAPLVALASVATEAPKWGRPADWVSAVLFTFAALLVLRPFLGGRREIAWAGWIAAGLCLLASVAVLLVPVTSQRTILGMTLSTRLVAISALTLAFALLRLIPSARRQSLATMHLAILCEGAVILPFLTTGHWAIYLLTQVLALGTFGILAYSQDDAAAAPERRTASASAPPPPARGPQPARAT